MPAGGGQNRRGNANDGPLAKRAARHKPAPVHLGQTAHNRKTKT